MRVVGHVRHREVGIFHVNRVELAVAAVVGIEVKTVEAIAVSGGDEKTVKQPGPRVAAVEVQVLS